MYRRTSAKSGWWEGRVMTKDRLKSGKQKMRKLEGGYCIYYIKNGSSQDSYLMQRLSGGMGFSKFCHFIAVARHCTWLWNDKNKQNLDPVRRSLQSSENQTDAPAMVERACCLVTKLCPTLLDSHGLQHVRFPCPSPTSGVCPSSYPLNR